MVTTTIKYIKMRVGEKQTSTSASPGSTCFYAQNVSAPASGQLRGPGPHPCGEASSTLTLETCRRTLLCLGHSGSQNLPDHGRHTN